MANGNFGGGDGTKLKPFLVEDAYDFNNVRNNLAACYLQTKDISLSVYTNWIPVAEGSYFHGVYDMDGYSITDLVCENFNASLFGRIGGVLSDDDETYLSGYLLNVNVVNAVVIGGLNENSNYERGSGNILAHYLVAGEIIDCSVSGVATGFYASGIVSGISKAELCKIERCSADPVIINGKWAAGISVWGTAVVYDDDYNETYPPQIIDCYSNGEIRGISSVAGYDYLGGLSCSTLNGFENCYTTTKLFSDRYGDKWSNFELWLLGGSREDTNQAVSCYGDAEIYGSQVVWSAINRYYEGDRLVRGSDGVQYKALQMQDNKDYTWNNDWNQTGPPSGFPFPFYNAEPPIGSLWKDYWTPVIGTDPTARNTVQMMQKDNYVDWDFETVWKIDEGKSYPTFLKASGTSTQCTAFPLFRRMTRDFN